MADIIKFREGQDKGPEFYYSNVIELVVGPYDFTFVWGFKTPEQAKKKGGEFTPLANISMSPNQAKAAVVIIKEMIDNYETQFGEIPLEKDFKERYHNIFGEKK
jgi:hypothetical protein